MAPVENLRMKEKLSKGEAIDVSMYPKDQDGHYILDGISDVAFKKLDFCDTTDNSWIWSIGKNKKTGQILAAKDVRFYQNDDYECLWLR